MRFDFRDVRVWVALGIVTATTWVVSRYMTGAPVFRRRTEDQIVGPRAGRNLRTAARDVRNEVEQALDTDLH